MEFGVEQHGYAKPASIRSVSAWSRGRDRAPDAAGAVGPVLHPDCAFHTDRERNAGWRVDLLDQCVIERVDILNRVSQASRLTALAIETAADGEHGTVRRLQFGREPVSSADDAPLVVAFLQPIPARHLRLRRIGDPDVVHLRRVRRFGVRVDWPPARS